VSFTSYVKHALRKEEGVMSADGLKALPWLALYALAFLTQPAAEAPSSQESLAQDRSHSEATQQPGI
jgi:hypothetical protein